jgi:hypothetical protein
MQTEVAVETLCAKQSTDCVERCCNNPSLCGMLKECALTETVYVKRIARVRGKL